MLHHELIYLATTLMLCALWICPRKAKAAIQNMVFNPGFEQLDANSRPDGWGSFNERDAARFEVTSDDVFVGKYALHLSAPDVTVWSPHFSKMMPLTPGAEYTLAGYCKTRLLGAEMLFALREVDSNGQSVVFQQVAVPAETDWKFLSATFKVGPNTTSGQVFLLLRNGLGDAWIDDILLTEGKPAELTELAKRRPQPALPARHVPDMTSGTNLISNNRFEQSLDSWSFVHGDAGQAASIDTKVQFTGSRSACQSHTTGGVPGSWLTLQDPVAVRSGTNFMLSGWLCTEGHSNWTGVPIDRAKRDEGACIILQVLDDKKQVISESWSRTWHTNGLWQRVQASARVPVNGWYINVRLFHGDLNGKSWFDSLRLELTSGTPDVSPTWRLPRDVYQAGALPPSYSGTAQLTAESGSPELILSLKAKNSVTLPLVDHSVPGSFQISGYARGTGKSQILIRDYDVDGHILAEIETPFEGSGTMTEWKHEYTPGTTSAWFTLSVRCETGKLALRDMRVTRLSSSNLQQYMDAPPSIPAVTAKTTAGTGLPSVKCVMRGSAPQITVNGKTVNFDQYWHENIPRERVIQSCRGGELVMAVIMEKLDWSTTPATINTVALDQQIQAILRRYPEAWITITPDTTASEHSSKPWASYNPSERYVNELGESQVPGYSGELRYFPSMASEKWQYDIDEMLRLLVDHVKKADYASRVIGFQLSPYEWFQWEWMRSRMDVSMPMQIAFRNWLKRKYTSDQALQAAWADSSVTVQTATIPSTGQRRATVEGVFRDPRKHQSAIDYARFYSELTADLLARQAVTVKKAAGKPTIVGTFYGYITTMIDGPSRESSGHLGLARLFSHHVIDYVIAPSDGYIFDREIGGTGGFMTTVDSFRLNGVLWVNQPDHRTHWAADNLARTETTSEDIHMFRREFALNLTSHTGQQYLDFSLGTALGDRRIGQEFARYAHIRRFADSLEPDADVSELAVVLSETAAACVGTEAVLMDGGTVYHQRPLFYRTGISHSTCLTSDLTNPQLRKQRLWIFTNTWQLSSTERTAIKSRCMKDGNTLLFMYAPGYITDKPSVENISRLLGMKVITLPGRKDARITIDPASRLPWLRDSRGIRYGHSPLLPWSPLFAVDDPKAIALGRYSDGHVGLAMREFGSYRVVYSAVGMLPPALLRDLGGLSKAHAYTNSNDALYVSQHFLGIHARSCGEKRITLPRLCDVYDLFTHKVIAKGVSSFTVNVRPFTTSLFYLGDANKALAFFKKA